MGFGAKSPILVGIFLVVFLVSISPQDSEGNDILGTDSDGDGVSDLFDQCPMARETYNNYHDRDGCPDVSRSYPGLEKMDENEKNHLNIIISPLKQMQSGVLPKNIDCRNDLILLIKRSNGKAVCVKESTSYKLEKKGWGLAIFAENINPPINTPEKPTAGIDDVIITLHRGMCFGTCPVYSLTILGNGTVFYYGNNFVDTLGMVKYQIETSDVQTLIDMSYELDYFSFKDSYQILVTDHSSTTTSFTVGNATKIIYNYANSAPAALNEFENKIEEIANSKQYVGMQP